MGERGASLESGFGKWSGREGEVPDGGGVGADGRMLLWTKR